MRVLFVTSRFPGPDFRGDQLRAYQQIRALSERHAITLLSAEPAVDPAHATELAQRCEHVQVLPRATWPSAWQALAALPRRRPLQSALYASWPPPAALAALLQRGRFDLAHVQLARLGDLLPRLAPLPCVLDLVDALSLNMRRRAAYDRAPLAWLARREAHHLARWERDLCAQASAVTIASGVDADSIGSSRALHRIDNGVDLQRFAYAAADGRSDVVFSGNLGYFPNVDAASWFAREVLPRLQARRPQLRLRLVGARPAATLRKLAAQQAGIDLIGPVADMHAALAAAAVAVVPLRAGSGQQLKLLEAMASGTPVVASRRAAEPLQLVDGEHLLCADTAEATADAVLRLLDDPELAARLAHAARAQVEQHYSWEASASALEQVWLSAQASAGNGGGAGSSPAASFASH